MDDYQAIVSACLFVILGIYAVKWYTNPIREIPTVGGSDLPGLSYLGALRMRGDCRDVLEEGYRKYPESAFKVALLDKWLVVVSGRKMVDEFRKQEELSSRLAIQEVMHSHYTLEPPVFMDKYHAEVVKEKLTRKLPAILPSTIDEVAVSVKEHIIANESEWTSVEILPVLQKIVARASNRAFVGLPLCRNEEYLSLTVNFSVGYLKSALLLRQSPRFLKPLVAFFANYPKYDTHRTLAYLQPLIEERRKTMAELGEGWNDKPNDGLQFLLDKASRRNETPFVIAQRLLILNFAAIHTSSTTITHALYHLAEKPESIPQLRAEIETCIAADGWTGTALGNMWKLDSLLRETLRYHGVTLPNLQLRCLPHGHGFSVSMKRIAMKDVTLADGTRIPRGTMVCAGSYMMHRDDGLFADGGSFDPFRFARMRGAEGQSAKHQFTSTSPEYTPFGYGHDACPGRFFASNELKAVLAQIILNYDVKLGGDGSHPPDVYVSLNIIPALRGCVLFKKREPLV